MMHPADKKLAKLVTNVPIFVWVIILVVGSTGTYYGYKYKQKQANIRMEYKKKQANIRKEYQDYVIEVRGDNMIRKLYGDDSTKLRDIKTFEAWLESGRPPALGEQPN